MNSSLAESSRGTWLGGGKHGLPETCFSSRDVRQSCLREKSILVLGLFIELTGHSDKFRLKLRRLLRDSDLDLGVTHVVVKFEAKLVDAIFKE